MPCRLVEAGAVYFFTVDGYGDSSGDFNLTLQLIVSGTAGRPCEHREHTRVGCDGGRRGMVRGRLECYAVPRGPTPTRELVLRHTSLLQATQPGETFENAVDLGNATTASYKGSTVPYVNSYVSKRSLCTFWGTTGPDQIFTWAAAFSGFLSVTMCTSRNLAEDGVVSILDSNEAELACDLSSYMSKCP